MLLGQKYLAKIERYPFLHFHWRRKSKLYNDKIKYLQLMSKLLKKKLLLWSFLMSKRCQNKALWIVWSELRMFLIQFCWLPPHNFIFEVKGRLLTHLVPSMVFSSNLAENLELLTTMTWDHFENAKVLDYKEPQLEVEERNDMKVVIKGDALKRISEEK